MVLPRGSFALEKHLRQSFLSTICFISFVLFASSGLICCRLFVRYAAWCGARCPGGRAARGGALMSCRVNAKKEKVRIVCNRHRAAGWLWGACGKGGGGLVQFLNQPVVRGLVSASCDFAPLV